MDEPKTLAPDADLIALRDAVNSRLGEATRVDFYRREDDGSMHTGIIYQFGSQRAVVTTPTQLSTHDAPEIVAAINRWVAGLSQEKWTTDPREAA